MEMVQGLLMSITNPSCTMHPMNQSVMKTKRWASKKMPFFGSRKKRHRQPRQGQSPVGLRLNATTMSRRDNSSVTLDAVAPAQKQSFHCISKK
jgi:hypothetical protein